ncbi:alpha/beta hydrolase-fold protein [Glutamicibacter ectropisis]|uniref:Alpha/beta hydrolase-fold protein n=1 Tax=Glutamicibacter ectropisis TaxID=3046593 RepID=A0AAU6WCY6_9MICC
MKNMHTKPETTPRSLRSFGYLAAARSSDQLRDWKQGLLAGELHTPVFEATADPEWVYAHFLLVEKQHEAPFSAAILSANALVDHRDLESSEFEQVTDGLWAVTLRVSADWRAGYRITTHRGEGLPAWRTETERRPIRLATDAGGLDEHNPLVGASMNGAPVSLAYAPASEVPEYLATATPDLHRVGPAIGGWGESAGTPEATHPRLHHHEVFDENCQRPRNLWMYEPANANGPTPLAIVHDGATYARFLAVADSLDAAIATGQLAPLHVLFIDSTTVDIRSEELPVLEGTTTSIAQQFLPWARKHYQISPHREDILVNGASFGGLAALLLVCHYPQLVGNALAQSPSLWHTNLCEEITALPTDTKVQIQAGCYETDIHDGCLSLLRHLWEQPSAATVDFESLSGGHDWSWWNPELLTGLVGFFPGPAHGDQIGK